MADIFVVLIFRAITKDPSCILCDSLLRFFLDGDHVQELESALENDRHIPAVATLEQGIQLVLGQLLQPANKVQMKPPRTPKGRFSTADVQAPATPLRG